MSTYIPSVPAGASNARPVLVAHSPRVGDLHDLDIAKAESIQCRAPAVRCGCGTELAARSGMRRLAEGAPRLCMQQVKVASSLSPGFEAAMHSGAMRSLRTACTECRAPARAALQLQCSAHRVMQVAPERNASVTECRCFATKRRLRNVARVS